MCGKRRQRCALSASSSVSCIFNLVATHTRTRTLCLNTPTWRLHTPLRLPQMRLQWISHLFSLVVARSVAATHQLVEARLMWHVANEFLPTAIAQPPSLFLNLAASCYQLLLQLVLKLNEFSNSSSTRNCLSLHLQRSSGCRALKSTGRNKIQYPIQYPVKRRHGLRRSLINSWSRSEKRLRSEIGLHRIVNQLVACINIARTSYK